LNNATAKVMGCCAWQQYRRRPGAPIMMMSNDGL